MKTIIWENNAGWCVLGWADAGIRLFEFGYRGPEAAEKAAARAGGETVLLKDAPDTTWLARDELDRYFRGEKTPLDLRPDWSAATEFQRAVWTATINIPYGETRSYAEVARAAGSPGATRAAGSALGANPIPVIVPCHRVLRSDGAMGGFATGVKVKQALLDLERGGSPDFKRIKFKRG